MLNKNYFFILTIVYLPKIYGRFNFSAHEKE